MERWWRGYRVSLEISFNGRVWSPKHHLLRQMAVKKDTDGSVQTDLCLHRHRERWKPDVNEKSAYERERVIVLFCVRSFPLSVGFVFLSLSLQFPVCVWNSKPNPTLPAAPLAFRLRLLMWNQSMPGRKIWISGLWTSSLRYLRFELCIWRFGGFQNQKLWNLEVLRFKIWRVFRF